MAAMCSESKPWTLRSLSFLLLVSYMTLARARKHGPRWSVLQDAIELAGADRRCQDSCAACQGLLDHSWLAASSHFA